MFGEATPIFLVFPSHRALMAFYYRIKSIMHLITVLPDI